MNNNLQSIVTSPKFKLAKTLECKILAGKFHNFIFETESPLLYKPGQFICIKVAKDRINSYSIASNEGKNKYSLLVDISPGGPGSKYFENLKPGDEINFLGPFGTFFFKHDNTGHIVFSGTGSGCAPLRSMIDHLLKVDRVQKPITLYLGLRYIADIFWQDYFTKLSGKYPNFKFILVISRPDASWQGRSGHVVDYISQDFPDALPLSAYLCGNISMIKEAADILISRGISREKIYTENF